MDADAHEIIRELRPHRVLEVVDEPSRLRAFIVLDSVVLGPAAGGVRTRRYASQREAVEDACRLARAMTLKCSLAGLDAGGAKAVVLDHPELDRAAAFEEIGRRVEALRGQFRTAGDYGTTDEDLAAMSRHTRYVHTDTGNLSGAVARGVLCCLQAAVDRKGRPGLSELTAAVQGCGDIGGAVARALVEAGAVVRVADLVPARAEAVAAEVGATVVDPKRLLFEDVDLLVPCAGSGVLTTAVASEVRAWVVCGGANRITVDDSVDRVLFDRGILHVPDLLSSAGAVIEGVGRTVMGLDDRRPLIDALGNTARLILEDAEREGTPPVEHARRRARARIDAAS
ncbi:MAG: Glu/Leu/Phe/Val dehydrogenase dimerization domain-containing protein [Sandaracinaceae bacterium]